MTVQPYGLLRWRHMVPKVSQRPVLSAQTFHVEKVSRIKRLDRRVSYGRGLCTLVTNEEPGAMLAGGRSARLKQGVVAMKVGALLWTALFEVELVVFLVTLLLTGYASLVLGRDQTIRPFYPHDATLWYSYRGDSISTEALFIAYYLVATPALYALKERQLRAQKQLTSAQRRVVAARMALGVWNATMVGIVVVELLKGYVGRLRPSFAEACLAREAPYNDEELSRVFYNNADCPSGNAKALHDMRRSFPSGHAALALGGGAYVQLCLTELAGGESDERAATLMYLSGCALSAFGFGVGASRVVDAAHHVGDVAVGSVIGLWAAVMQFWHVRARSGRMVGAARARAIPPAPAAAVKTN